MTDHAPRDENRNRLWIGLTILVVVAAAVVGWHFVQKREPIVPVSKPAVEDSKATAGAEAGLVEASPANSSEPRATHSTDAASEKSPSATIAPKDAPAIAPWDTSRNQPVLIIPPPDDEEVVDEEVLPDHPLINIPGNWPQPIKASAAPEVAKIEPASLQEAISQMTLSILMYIDNKAERIVYINGRKYEEGDYIEGIYLLESITGDGAIISHQGERTLLQPKPK